MGSRRLRHEGGLVTILHAAEAVQHTGASEDLSVCIAFNSDEEVGSNARAVVRRSGGKKPPGVGFRALSCHWPSGAAAQGCGRLRSHMPWPGGPCRGGARKGCQRRAGTRTPDPCGKQFFPARGGTSVSVTTVSGGIAGNVIPDFAKAGFDIRIASLEEARRIEASFQNISVSGKATACGWRRGGKSTGCPWCRRRRPGGCGSRLPHRRKPGP